MRWFCGDEQLPDGPSELAFEAAKCVLAAFAAGLTGC